MQRIIDLALELPPTPEQAAGRLALRNTPATSKSIATVAVLDNRPAIESTDSTPITIPQFISLLDEAGIEAGVVNAGSAESTTAICECYPGRLIGTTTVNPYRGMGAVKALEQAVRDFDIKAFSTQASRYCLHVNDKKYYPLYAKAAELDIPVLIFDSDSTESARDISRPLYVDEVATDFPELRLVAELGNWYWVPEIVGLVRRHDHLFICPTLQSLASPDARANWQQLAQAIPDRVVFGSGRPAPPQTIIDVARATREIELAPDIKEKWLCGNARKLFHLD